MPIYFYEEHSVDWWKNMRKRKNTLITTAISIMLLAVTLFTIPSFGGVHPPTTLEVEPKYTWTVEGAVFSVNISVKDVKGLISYDVQLAYDTQVMDGINLTIMPFLPPPTVVIKAEIDEIAGNIWVAVQSSDPVGSSGNGTLFSATFQCTAVGLSLLDLHDTFLGSPEGVINHDVLDGYVWQLPYAHGPRSDLNFSWYSSSDELYAALKACELELMGHPLNYEQLQDAIADHNIQLAWTNTSNSYYEYTINHNYSISSHPDAMSPTRDEAVRSAISYSVDKEYIIDTILVGNANRIDYPILPAWQSWWPDPPYPHRYNLTRAIEILNDRGFIDIDGNGWLNYPPDWPGAAGADTTEYPLRIVFRIDDPIRYEIGMYLVSQMESVGFATEPIACTSEQVYEIVFLNKDYHVYIGSWDLGNVYPPVYLRPAYHSSFWCTSNIVLPPSLPYSHEIDEYLDRAYFANYPDGAEGAKHYIQLFCKAHFNHTVTIPLAAPRVLEYWAYKKHLVAVVNMLDKGLNNKYTYLNAYRADGNPTIRIGMIGPPESLNPIYPSTWPDDAGHEILDILYPHLINLNPYDLTLVQPWIAQDWEVGTWTDTDGTEKTNITFYLRKDVGLVAPVTGGFIRFYNVSDVEFSLWYLYAFQDSWDWDLVSDIRFTKIIDDTTIEVYFDSLMGWSALLNFLKIRLMPKYELIEALGTLPLTPLISKKTVSFLWDSGEIQFTKDPVLQVVEAYANGIPISEGENFLIRGGKDVYCHNVFVPIEIPSPVEPVNITITYYYPTAPPYGYYLGSDAGLTWSDTMYTIGSHYPASSPSNLKRNNYFFLETPLLGEVDWRWIWNTPLHVPGWMLPGRDGGYFEISIYDVVKVTAAYGSRGDGEPDPRWFPGADLDSYDLCHIGIFDVVTVAGKYGLKWGQPSP